jgi:hypothetical protein
VVAAAQSAEVRARLPLSWKCKSLAAPTRRCSAASTGASRHRHDLRSGVSR